MKDRKLKKLTLPALVLALGFILGLYSWVPKVHAQSTFNNASIAGSYGYSLQGWFFPASPPAPGGTANANDIPAAAVGVMSFSGTTDGDGNGTCAFSDIVNLGGSIFARNITNCTYSVNSNGTGTMNFVSSGLNKSRAFAITDGGNEIQQMEADAEGVNRGVGRRQ
jgi:hypothetical protein